MTEVPLPPTNPAMAPQAAGSAINVNSKFFPLSFFFLFTKPKITIDGYEIPQQSWGRQSIPVQPGRHQIDIHTPYFLPPRIGPASAIVDCPPGQAVELEYRPPVWAFSAGSLGTPPQKYNGLWIYWVLAGIIALAIICCCGSALLSNN